MSFRQLAVVLFSGFLISAIVAYPRSCRSKSIRYGKRITTKFFKSGQKLTYVCLPGYQLVGTATLTCKPNGRWSHRVPSCKRVTQCRRPNDPENGSINPPHVPRFNPGTKIWFQCEHPYTLVGTKDFKCQSNGRFSPRQFPKCVACQPPQTPDNGQLRPVQDLYSVGQKISFKCDRNFRLEGANHIECLNTGLYSDDVPQCVRDIQQCERPEEPENGSIRPPNVDLFNPGQKLWFSCNKPYTLVGKADFRCQDNGEFNSQDFPECVACQPPQTPDNGQLRPVQDLYSVGQKISFKCDRNFRLEGANHIECLNTGLYSDDVPECVRDIQQCERPEEPENGSIRPPNVDLFNPGQKLWFSCNKPYTLVGKADFRCQDNGEFNSQDFPECVACQSPQTPDNGQLRPVQDLYSVGQKISFKCDRNFRLEGASRIECLNTGLYSDDVPECVRDIQQCERPEEPENGSIRPPNVDLFNPGQKLWFSCNKPYTLVGKADFRCQDNGEFNSQDFPECVACQSPQTPDNGQLRPVQDLYRVGQRVDFKCDKNFQLQGAGWIKCLNTGLWSDDEPQCLPRAPASQCKRPEEPNKGYIHPRRVQSFKPGKKIWFRCNRPYTLVGKKDFKCQKDGNWDSDDFPTCQRVVIACENSRRSYVKCPRGYKIKVLSGFYGRDNTKSCRRYNYKNTSCASSRGSEEKLKRLCHDKQSCRLQPNGHFFGDPCPGVYKYVRIVYECVKH